jgi:hypothetical protein
MANVISVPPSSWPWYERFGYLFASNIKINGVPQMLIGESPLLIAKFKF